MNALRSKTLGQIVDHLDVFRASLQDIMMDEETARDNIPEGLRESSIYARAKKACADLSRAIDNLDDAITAIEEARL